MKTSVLIVFAVVSLWTVSSSGQTSTATEDPIRVLCASPSNAENQPLYMVDGVAVSDKEILRTINPKDVTSIDLLKGKEALEAYGKSGKNGVVIIQTQNANDSTEIKKLEKLPFQVYSLKNTGWIIQQDIYNALRAKVPSLTISNSTNLGLTPAFRIRGNDTPIILLDGVRVDASILNTLNPQDIESIHVAPSAAGTNYFLNGYRAN
ncbi:MAG: TonB-dependent receptor plug domain-containing protein [Bacteroidota bacterium]